MNGVGKPLVVITGARGNVGRALGEHLAHAYEIIGIDRLPSEDSHFPIFVADFSNAASIALALERIARTYGRTFASVIHLAAYYALSDQESPLYQSVNVDGTRELLHALQEFDVQQFIFGSTMLVHRSCKPGERIDESSPIEPAWVYPRSKAAAEHVVEEFRGSIPAVILRLAGVYDEERMVPTLARQFARIYSREVHSYFYSGSVLVGQAMLHREDMHDAFSRTIEARSRLAGLTSLLIGESDAMGYDALQDEIGRLLHGKDDWPTYRVPKSLAAAGSWVQGALEPAIPNAIDSGPPFIKPFMVRLADDHYALDTSRARTLLGWEARRRIKNCLPDMVAALRRDPAGWYAAHDIPEPAWLSDAQDSPGGADTQRVGHESLRRAAYAENQWPHFANVGLGAWLVTQPFIVDVPEPALRVAEIGLGAALMVLALASLSWRATWARWACAAIGVLVMAAPFVFWTQSAAAYSTDTLIGALVFAFAVCLKPEPGTSAAAAMSGPTIPWGWSYNPSGWTQRLPIILMALFGLYVSRHLAAYQLGHIPTA